MGERRRLLGSDEAEQVTEAGARGEFEASDLVNELDQTVAKMEKTVAKAGYRIMEGERGFSWPMRTPAKTSTTVPTR